MILIVSLLIGVAVAWLVMNLAALVAAPRCAGMVGGRFEENRRSQLRLANRVYRWCEPLVDELAVGFERRVSEKRRLTLQRDLVASGNRTPWQAEEFLATRRLEAIGAGMIGGLFGWLMGGVSLTAVGLIAGFCVYEFLAKRLVKSHAIRRRITIKRRFAAAIELMALMMEVGGNFQESLEVVARETQGHALGDELAAVLRDMEMGRPRAESLRGFAERTDEEEVKEMVMAVVEGEELGTPLAKTLRTQADQMRQKRSQWAEKAAEESQVSLVFPAMLIMVACLITVAAPFILNALYSSTGM